MLSARKADHLRICLEKDVASECTTGLERYRLIHEALPEMALCEVDLSTEFMGRRLQAPLLISAMTGGTEGAQEINIRLARAAQEFGLAMALGSQRAALENPALMITYQVREVAPDILLFANLGAVQLNEGYDAEMCRRAVESVGADALILHLNPLQEALQPEGDTNFRGLAGKIEEICQTMPVPVLVKEVGYGLSLATAQKLYHAGVWGLDIAGAGGTSWSKVEAHRASSPEEAQVASAFASWGIPTAEALISLRAAWPDWPLIASGGIRNGVEIALCLALGANLVGIARPLLQAAVESYDALHSHIRILLQQLRIAMFCTGARTVADLNPTRLAKRNPYE